MTLLDSHPLLLDKKLAVILGLNQALLVQQIHYWLEKNKEAGRNFHQGKYWTYNTIDQWQEEFPFWSRSTIKRSLKGLRERGILEVDNFNSYQMDRTLWYTINYKELARLEEEYDKGQDQVSPKEKGEASQAGPRGERRDQKGSEGKDGKSQAGPMDKGKPDPAIPETPTKISPDICNQSIYPPGQDLVGKDGHACKSLEYMEGQLEEGPGHRKEDRTDDRIEIRTAYREIIKNCQLYAIDEKYRAGVGHAIKLLLLEAEGKTRLKIGNNYLPAKIVREDLRKLDYFMVEYAVNRFKEISRSQEIINPLAYLKTLIYNSINEMEISLEADLRYGGFI